MLYLLWTELVECLSLYLPWTLCMVSVCRQENNLNVGLLITYIHFIIFSPNAICYFLALVFSQMHLYIYIYIFLYHQYEHVSFPMV